MSPHTEDALDACTELGLAGAPLETSDDDVTVVASVVAAKAVEQDPCEAQPTIVRSAKSALKRAPSKRIGPKLFAFGLGLVALGFVGSRAIFHAFFATAPVGHTAAPRVEARAAVPPRSGVATKQSTPVREATPMAAATSFALGENVRALGQYRHLAQAHPEVEAYAAIVKVLSSERQEH